MLTEALCNPSYWSRLQSSNVAPICPRCGGPKEPPPTPMGKRSYCKACDCLRRKEWLAADPKRLEAARASSANRPREKKSADNKAFYAKNREAQKARAAAYRSCNREQTNAVATAWRKENPERYSETKRSWNAANKVRNGALRRAKYAENRDVELAKASEWKRNNRGKCAALFMRRKATKLQASPSWADAEAIEAIYEQARNVSAETGIKYHVDHIVPLQSKFVCGLHVEANLQILTAPANQSKSNRVWPDMPAELRASNGHDYRIQ